MSNKPNAQYNLSAPNSFSMRIAHRQRQLMYRRFLELSDVVPSDTVLDVGATSDATYSISNYVEAWYPHKEKLTACGIDDARFLEDMYPGLKFTQANGLDLPFSDQSFDVVHSSAVLEHVGSFDNQCKFVVELCRVARKSIFLTTPNRWFPVEVHTSLPLIHWLPKWLFRKVLAGTSLDFFAHEQNLNLMDKHELRRASNVMGWRMSVHGVRLGPVISNLMLVGHRTMP